MDREPGCGRAFLLPDGEGFGDLKLDGLGCSARVGSLRDGAADYQVGSAIGDGLCRGGDALLVLSIAAGRADSGGDEGDVVAEDLSQGCRFLSGTDEAAQAGVNGDACQQRHLIERGRGHADGGELACIHAGEYRDREQS